MIPRLVWTLLSNRRYPGWRRHLARIRRISRLDETAFGAWRAEAAARHVRWAGSHIPYWRERIRPWSRLEDLPPLSRCDLQANVDDLRDPGRSLEEIEEQTSGGSTGEPVVLYQDRAFFAWDHATEVHVAESWGQVPWSRSAYLWGSDQDVGDLPRRSRLYLGLMGRLIVNAFRMGEADLPRITKDLTTFRPIYLQGYASALDLLASWLLRHRPDHGIRPRVIRSSAEALRPDARARIEEAFSAPVRDFYGARECATIAAECRAGRMHVQAHGRVVEIVDDRGRPVPPGVPGRVLVTDLTNRAFGLLRYETGDVSSWASQEGAPCACGTPYPVLERVWGRTSDFITTPSGERIHGEWFTHLFYGRRDVSRFQVHQSRPEHLAIRTVGRADRGDLADLLDDVRARVGADVEVTWERVDDIPTTPSGKRRFTVSEVAWHPERS